MTKFIATVCIAICLSTCAAFGDTRIQSDNSTVIIACSGLLVRTTAATVRSDSHTANPGCSAINTAGVTRATIAVRSGGRVFLRAAGRPSPATRYVRTPTKADAKVVVAVRTNRTKRADGLGMALARLLGFAKS